MSASQLPTARVSAVDSRPTTPRRPRRKHGESPLVLDRYRLQRRLGSGAFATVWLAHDERLQREVAVKILTKERIVGGRFEREARAAARLVHPAVVTLYEAEVDDDGAYLVSELVRGSTVDQLLSAGLLSDQDIIAVGMTLCDALSYAHSQGVVHRDVKPSNVLVPDAPPTPSQVAKLTDFGVARLVGGDSLTRTGDVVGTVAYMAPEQAEGLEVGPPADLYSLALVIYEALTGLNPVRTGSAGQRTRRLGTYLPPLRRQRRDLPRELGVAIDLALRPRPRERGTVTELRAALADAHAAATDIPGVVTGAWPRSATDTGDSQPFRVASAPRTARNADPAVDPVALDQPEVESWPPRALAAAGAAIAAGWVTAHVLAPAPVAPAAAAVLAAVLVAALPRLGWLAMTGALALGAAVQGHPGGSALIALLGLIPVPFLPRDGTAWPLPVGAPVLGVVGLGGAWPAVAARAGGAWRRGVLGALGWVLLVLAGAIKGSGLYLTLPAGTASMHLSSGSLHQTFALMVRPIITSGALVGAPVWAIASITLPWLTRGRSLPLMIVLVTAWSAMVVSATATAIALVHPGETLLPTGTAVAGAIVGALIALAPALVRAARERG